MSVMDMAHFEALKGRSAEWQSEGESQRPHTGLPLFDSGFMQQVPAVHVPNADMYPMHIWLVYCILQCHLLMVKCVECILLI